MDDDFTVIIRCPHGNDYRMPLLGLRGLEPITDPCAEAVAERAQLEAERALSRRQLSLRHLLERRRFRRALKREADQLL